MTQIPQPAIDTGTAYGMKPPTYRTDLVEVGAGTPMGELMRRYWQPCFTSEALTSDRPHKVRLLGEDLILFRDKNGRPGLVHEHCCHRGTSLYYGRIEDDGIRCCYHGWKFGVDGQCLEQPAEVDGGRFRSKIRQPWYPVEERYGLVYTYMGPPEKKPILPHWSHLSDLGPDEIITASPNPAYGFLSGEGDIKTLGFNWLQAYENSMDAPHAPWLHYHHSGDQFTGQAILDDHSEGGAHHAPPPAEVPPYAFIKDLAGAILADRTTLGVKQGVPFPVPGGGQLLASNEAIVPNMVVIFQFIDLMYIVPADDTSFYVFMLFREKFKGEKSNAFELHSGKTWWEMTNEEHQTSPGDFEAQGSIGKVPAHSREHLSQGDVPISMLRRRLEEAVRGVAEGRDPPGVTFDKNSSPLVTVAHGFIPYEPAV